MPQTEGSASLPREPLSEQPATSPARLAVAEQMFCPLPAALLWVTEMKRWPGWGEQPLSRGAGPRGTRQLQEVGIRLEEVRKGLKLWECDV